MKRRVLAISMCVMALMGAVVVAAAVAHQTVGHHLVSRLQHR